jgi:hypothetical protein
MHGRIPPLFGACPEPQTYAQVLDFDVVVWRFDELCKAGYPMVLASELAERGYIDLHEACELLREGCSVQLAKEILL